MRRHAPKRSTAMCTACIAVLGTFVGAVAAAKSGGLGSAKTALVAFASQYLFLRGRK